MQPTHLLFVLVIALLVLGPKRLPEVGRQLGHGIRDFRAAINGERAHPEEELDAGSKQNGADAELHHPPVAPPAEHEPSAADPAEQEFAHQPVETAGDERRFAHASPGAPADERQFVHEEPAQAEKPVDST